MTLTPLRFPRSDRFQPDALPTRTAAQAAAVQAAMPAAITATTQAYWTLVKDHVSAQLDGEMLLPKRLANDPTRAQLQMAITLPNMSSLHDPHATPAERARVTEQAISQVVDHLKTQFSSYDQVDVTLAEKVLVDDAASAATQGYGREL